MLGTNLSKKTIIITGGLGLLGRAFCHACAKAGARVVVADIEEKEGKEFALQLQKETGNEALFVHCDITSEKSVEESLKKIVSRFETIDALVNNAYPRNKNYGKTFEKVTYKDFCENVDAHLGGYFLMTQRVAVLMQKQGHGNIVNMASMYGFCAPRFEIYEGTDMTMPVEYAAIKGAVLNLTRYLAAYLGKDNIRVNALSPGGIFDNQHKDFVGRYSQRVLLGKRMASPQDIVGTLLFLLSDASSYITGQNIVVDGGFSLG